MFSKWRGKFRLGFVAALCALLTGMPAAFAETASELFAKTEVEISGGRLKMGAPAGQFITLDAQRATYAQAFPDMRSFDRARVFVSVGGVLLGRPPTAGLRGQVQPLSVPKFEYQLLEPEGTAPHRVRMTFGAADGTTWQVTVPTAIVHAATAMACDGRCVAYTLTAGDDPVVHPALDGHLMAWRAATMDLYADNRISDRLAARLLVAAMKEGDRANVPGLGEVDKSLLSIVEERPWTLGPAAFAQGDVVSKPGVAQFQLTHRVAYDGVDKLSIMQARQLFAESPLTRLVRTEVQERLLASDRVVWSEFDDFVIIQRFVRSLVLGRITDFPIQSWDQMLLNTADVERANQDDKLTPAALHKGSVDWHTRAVKYLDPDTRTPNAQEPQTPEAWRFN